MAWSALQNFADRYLAVFSITSVSKFEPKNDGTTAGGLLTAIVDPNTPANALKPNADGSINVVAEAQATAGITPVVSTTTESGHVLKNAAGDFYGVSGYVSAGCFIMVFDSATVPADGAVAPSMWAYSAAAGSYSIDLGDIPNAHANGISVCASSTGPFTKTATAIATFSGRVK